jgi:F-type H+-transporting ATPase subunit a
MTAALLPVALPLTLPMSDDIAVGEHPTVTLGGLTFNVDTMVSTVVCGAIVVVLGLLAARAANAAADGVPGKLQIAFEAIVGQLEGLTGSDLRAKAPYVLPLAFTLFTFILVCNWITVLPSGHHPDRLPPPTADVNLTYALGLLVFFWFVGAAIRENAKSYFGHFAKPYKVLSPINVLEEIIKPFTLALRLFGNIFAGTVMVMIFTLLPEVIAWLPTTLWELFDLFIGLIQAFIFALLTIIYFGMALGAGEGH